MMDNVALEWGFLPVLLFSPVSTIPPMSHTRPHLQVALTRRTNGGSVEGPSKK